VATNALRTVRLSDLDEKGLRSWAELAERAVEPNPYLHPDFVMPAARAAGALGKVMAATVGSADGWDACFPVRRARRWRRLPIPGTVTWLHDQCFLGTPLVAPEDPGRSVANLLGGLRQGRYGAFAELDWTDEDGPLAGPLRDACPQNAFRFGRFTRAALHRRPENNYLEGRVKGKHRRSFRRMGRDLATELGGELQLLDRTGEERAVSDFMALEAAGWKGERGTALRSKPGTAWFFEEVCRAFAARDALQLLFLEAAGRPVAARCNLRAGPVLFCFKVAFDEDLRRFSPGMLMELRMIDHFHADPRVERMDSCAMPDSEVFNRLWADRRALTGLLVPLRGARGQAALPALRAVTNAVGRRRQRRAATGDAGQPSAETGGPGL
jgi:CelD/BcsL family acetyltransferase involved in cellulose biosynthesis